MDPTNRLSELLETETEDVQLAYAIMLSLSTAEEGQPCSFCDDEENKQHFVACSEKAHYFCGDCFKNYVRGAIQNKEFSDRIKCADTGCVGSINQEDLKKFPEINKQISCEVATILYRHERSPECLIQDALSESAMIVCPNCQCPGVKVEGCEHITCPQCRQNYCNACEEPIVDGNAVSEHYTTQCRQFARDETAYPVFRKKKMLEALLSEIGKLLKEGRNLDESKTYQYGKRCFEIALEGDSVSPYPANIDSMGGAVNSKDALESCLRNYTREWIEKQMAARQQQVLPERQQVRREAHDGDEWRTARMGHRDFYRSERGVRVRERGRMQEWGSPAVAVGTVRRDDQHAFPAYYRPCVWVETQLSTEQQMAARQQQVLPERQQVRWEAHDGDAWRAARMEHRDFYRRERGVRVRERERMQEWRSPAVAVGTVRRDDQHAFPVYYRPCMWVENQLPTEQRRQAIAGFYPNIAGHATFPMGPYGDERRPLLRR